MGTHVANMHKNEVMPICLRLAVHRIHEIGESGLNDLLDIILAQCQAVAVSCCTRGLHLAVQLQQSVQAAGQLLPTGVAQIAQGQGTRTCCLLLAQHCRQVEDLGKGPSGQRPGQLPIREHAFRSKG